MTNPLRMLCNTSARIGYFSFSLEKNAVTYDQLGTILYNNLKRFWFTSEKDVAVHPEIFQHDQLGTIHDDDHSNPVFLSPEFISDYITVKKLTSTLPLAISREFSSNSPITALIRSDYITRSPVPPNKFLSTSYFIHPGSSNEMFNRIQRSKKIWWMKFCSNPGRVFFSERQIFNKNDELISVKARFDFGEVELERIRLFPNTIDDFLVKSTKRGSKNIHPHIIQTQTCPDIGTMAILFDAIESSNTSSSSLHLHRKIAPFQCSIHSMSSSIPAVNVDLQDLVHYLSLVLKMSNVSNINNTTKELLPLMDYHHSSVSSLENNLTALDEIGVPYTLVLDETSLLSGMLKLRSRDTGLNEIIHLSDVPDYLIKIINA